MPELSKTELGLIAWALEANLRDLVQHQNYVRSLIGAEHLRHSDAASRLRLAEMDSRHASAGFLLTFAYLEEMLFSVLKTAARDITVPGRTGVLERYKPVIVKLVAVEVGSLPCWSHLIDAGIVRNCLMHAHGRVGLMGEASAVEACVRRNKGLLEIRRDYLRLTPAYLRKVVRAVRELRRLLLGA